MTILFFICAVLAIIAAVGVISCRTPLHSALCLIASMVCLAVIYLLHHAEFIAVLQIAVYAGAVMTLMIFTIFLVDMGRAAVEKRTNNLKGIGIVGGGLVVLTIVLFLKLPTGLAGEMTNDKATVEYIADQLFQNYLLPFEVASILLLVGLVGAVALAKKKL